MAKLIIASVLLLIVALASIQCEATNDKAEECASLIENDQTVTLSPILENLRKVFTKLNANLGESSLVNTIKNDDVNFDLSEAEGLGEQEALLEACDSFTEKLGNIIDRKQGCDSVLDNFIETPKAQIAALVDKHQMFDKYYGIALICEQI